MGTEYWFLVILFVSQSISGRLKSPQSQKVDFLNLDLISVISSHMCWHCSKFDLGGLYAQHKIRGDLPGTFILTKTVSENLPL